MPISLSFTVGGLWAQGVLYAILENGRGLEPAPPKETDCCAYQPPSSFREEAMGTGVPSPPPGQQAGVLEPVSRKNYHAHHPPFSVGGDGLRSPIALSGMGGGLKLVPLK